MGENKSAQYLKYAIGEIILVVIGILIALQINNWNTANKSREKELTYLKNIKSDLILNNAQIDAYLATRNGQIESANIILSHYEGVPVEDLRTLNTHLINIYTWQRYFQIDNTFQELINSGNLALISSDSIKGLLLELDSEYKKLKAEEDHFRFDAETLLYKPAYRIMDINPAVANYAFQLSQGQAGADLPLNAEIYARLMNDLEHKNGFVMVVYEFGVMNATLAHMKEISNEIIALIDAESPVI